MVFITAIATVCCVSENEPVDYNTGKLKIETVSSDAVKSIYYVTVSAKNWQSKNAFERFIDIPLTSINEEIVNKGDVQIYLIEKEKFIELPFNYYQVRRILSFEPSYKQGHAYITIFGNFIVNVSASYRFKIIISAPGSNNKTDLIP